MCIYILDIYVYAEKTERVNGHEFEEGWWARNFRKTRERERERENQVTDIS